ncbi:MAG: T9SS type A sorting domain-containing protein [Bacteroidia bacterium]
MPGPSEASIGAAIFCDGDSVRLSLPGYRSVQWSTGDTGTFVTLYDSDTLTATVVDSFGCEGTLSPAYVRAIPLPMPVIQWNMGHPATSSGFLSYQWYWYDSTDQSLTPLAVATAQSLAGINYENDPNNTGVLVVQVSDALCSGFSEPFSLATTGISVGENSFRIYPQPATNHFRLELPEELQAGFSLWLTDINGKKVLDFGVVQYADNHEFTIDVPAGVYMLNLEKGGKRRVEKILFSKKE